MSGELQRVLLGLIRSFWSRKKVRHNDGVQYVKFECANNKMFTIRNEMHEMDDNSEYGKILLEFSDECDFKEVEFDKFIMDDKIVGINLYFNIISKKNILSNLLMRFDSGYLHIAASVRPVFLSIETDMNIVDLRDIGCVENKLEDLEKVPLFGDFA